MNIISFSGKKNSGKTTLANICQNNYNYQIINFADELKYLICHCLDITPEYLELHKNDINSNYIMLNQHINYISTITSIPVSDVYDIIHNYKFYSIREIMQIIGTDLIRKYNHNWHIQKLKEKIKPNAKYCIGDCRFPNEKQVIDDLNGTAFYIVRDLNSSDTHSSECSLSFHDFNENFILYNNSNIDDLINQFKNKIY